MYYAHINSRNILTGIDLSELSVDEYGSTSVQNIEVEEDVYNEREQYIYNNGNIEKNPNYASEKLQELKLKKYAENDRKASESRYGKEFEVEVQGKDCIFDTSDQTQRDLLTAFAVCSTGETYDGWITNNGVMLDLTLEDVALISQTFKAESDVYGQWNTYKQAIDKAKTIKDLERIVIEYD